MKKMTISTAAIIIISILSFCCNKIEPVVPLDPNNKYPIANAGPDQEITLPASSVELDGSASNDPDGYINYYRWSQVSSNASVVIVAQGSSNTTIRNLVPGTFLFVLGVRDNGGLIAVDTVQVIVHQATGTCDVTDRPQINATLTQIGTLSFAGPAHVVSFGDKIFFAGGSNEYAGVDIYDVNEHTWQRLSLSQARNNMAIVVCENKIFFAGGNNYEVWYDNVDIYDIPTGAWSIANLSEAKSVSTAASIGDKVFFAGGITEEGFNQTNRVDIYDISDDSWSFADLSEPKIGVSTVSAGNKIYFAGGWNYLSGFYNPMIPLKSVDVYDASTNSWSGTNLNFISGGVSGIEYENTIYWGGKTSPEMEGIVELWNSGNGMTTSYCLSYPRNYPTAVLRNNEIIFFTPGDNEFLSDQFDIYNTVTGKWSIGKLDHTTAGCGVISVNNTIYVAGGRTSNDYTDKVYILNW